MHNMTRNVACLRMAASLIAGLLSVGLFTSCASKGFNRGALREQLGVKAPVVSDQEIKDLMAKKPNLPKPFRLAVYFKQPNGNARHAEWRWSEQDKALFDDTAKSLREQGLVSDAFPIIGSMVENESLRSIRVAAAKHQADAVLIIDGMSDVDRYTNNFAWTYLLIAPALFVPGSEADALFISNATLWDVRNEYLYLTAEAENVVHQRYVPAFGDSDRQLLDQAKSAALAKLKTQIVAMIDGQKDK